MERLELNPHPEVQKAALLVRHQETYHTEAKIKADIKEAEQQNICTSNVDNFHTKRADKISASNMRYRGN